MQSVKYYDNYMASSSKNEKGQKSDLEHFDCEQYLKTHRAWQQKFDDEKYMKLGQKYKDLKSQVLKAQNENEYKMKMKLDQKKHEMKQLQIENGELKKEIAYQKRMNNKLTHEIPKIQFDAEQLKFSKFKIKEL